MYDELPVYKASYDPLYRREFSHGGSAVLGRDACPLQAESLDSTMEAYINIIPPPPPSPPHSTHTPAHRFACRWSR